MSPTLESGDIIMVSKMSYGPRVIKFRKLFKEKKLEYKWYKGYGSPQVGDVFVFNWPDYPSLIENRPNFYGGFIVKRCFAKNGDTVFINERNEEINRIGGKNHGFGFEVKSLLFPYDSTLNWKIDHYGPLWVPGKGKTMKLSAVNTNHYKGMLLFEGNTVDIRNDSVFLNGNYASDYAFKENYYFMRGDNFYGSIDSRYWGFVPEKSIVGKAVLVLFSLDPDKPWYRKFRWKRFLKKV